MPDYERARREFSWARVRGLLAALPFSRSLNIAHEAVDGHAASERAAHVAIRAIAIDGTRRDFTYADLDRQTSRFGAAARPATSGTWHTRQLISPTTSSRQCPCGRG